MVGVYFDELVDPEKVPYDIWADAVSFCLAHSKTITFVQLVVKQSLLYFSLDIKTQIN